MARRLAFLTAVFLTSLLAVDLYAAPDRTEPERDRRIVTRCNVVARTRMLSPGEAALCSGAYERLLDRLGGYAAYVADREARPRKGDGAPVE